MAKAKVTKTKKKKSNRGKIKQGIVHIQSTYNNTVVTISDLEGNALVQSSPGRIGFGGARKATPFAAGQAVADAIERAKPFGLEEVHVRVKGVGSARDSAVRSLGSAGLGIITIRDITPIPHNGVRPPKRRRV